MAKTETKDCFIIMPIGESDEYDDGHFKHVYENIIKPSCISSGYQSIRADEVNETNLIHLDILKKLIEAPMAICDLSSRNPNVLFELGVRQAFDKPVVLIQEKGTPKIFDIAPLRYIEYSKEMKYHEVLSMQEELKTSIEATANAESDSSNINSIVKLLALSTPAHIPDLENGGKEGLALEVLQVEMQQMRRSLERSIMSGRPFDKKGSISAIEYERISNNLERLKNNRRLTNESKSEKYHQLLRDVEELVHTCSSSEEHQHFKRLHDRVRRAERDIYA